MFLLCGILNPTIYLTELNHCINMNKPTSIKHSGACPMFYLQVSQVEALTSSHGGEHTGSLFIQNKSPVFIISPGKHNKQTSRVVQRGTCSVVSLIKQTKKNSLLWSSPSRLDWPQTRAVSQQHVQVALQRVLIEGAAQPGTTTAELWSDVAQGVEPLQLMAVQVLLHIEPEGQLWWCGGGETKQSGKRKAWENKWDQQLGGMDKKKHGGAEGRRKETTKNQLCQTACPKSHTSVFNT